MGYIAPDMPGRFDDLAGFARCYGVAAVASPPHRQILERFKKGQGFSVNSNHERRRRGLPPTHSGLMLLAAGQRRQHQHRRLPANHLQLHAMAVRRHRPQSGKRLFDPWHLPEWLAL